MVLQQIKLLILGLIGFVRRLCCFGRRRKPSFSAEALESIKVESTNPQLLSKQTKYVERDWNSWDDTPRTVEEHIEEYRQRIAKPPTPQTEVVEPDLFSELTPVIKPQPKYYLANQTHDKTDFSRLEAKTDVPIAVNADLEDWDEEDVAGGWEELDTEKTKQLIREKRRELRSQRQKLTKTSGTDTNANGIGATRLNETYVQQSATYT